MRLNQSKKTHPSEITIDSNWIMILGMALPFVVCGGFLIRDILAFLRHGVQHNPKPIYILLAVYYFVLIYSFPSKLVKVAFLLLGTEIIFRIAFSYLHISAVTQHFVDSAASMAHLTAFILILFAIAQWFKSVVRRTSPSPTADSRPLV